MERLGDTFLIKDGTNVISAPSLPSLQILPWICPRPVTNNELANNMVVYKNFNTNGACTNAVAGTQVKDEIGVQSNGFIHDTGSTGVFQKITATGQTNGETRNVVSGKLDSSTTGGPLTNPNNTENLQTLIPFMNIYDNNGGALSGTIMVYVAPHDIVQTNGQYSVFLAFKYIPVNDYTKIYENPDIAACLGKSRSDNIAFLISNDGWQSYTITDQVPNLPDISDYMSGARGCFSAILKNIFTGSSLENKCKPYKDIAVNLWEIIGQSTIFQNDQNLFIMAFLMKVKWLGDLFRLIDSFMLTEVFSMPTSTATIDTFMKRFACLSNLYVYCANKGGDLTINDVKTLTPEQMQEIEQRNRTNKIRNMKSKIEWYKSLINNIDVFKTNWISTTIKSISNGIFGKGNVTLKPLRNSNRIVNKLLQCISSESYIYKHDKNKETTFALNEMSSILDYFLTLFCYNQAFNVVYATDIANTVNGLPDIDIATVTNDIISANEDIINGIEQNMNIIDKYNTISNFVPQYDNRNHRRLFEDSVRFLSMKDLDMSTAIQFLNEPKYTQLPKLVYTPQVGDTIREQFGNITGGTLIRRYRKPSKDNNRKSLKRNNVQEQRKDRGDALNKTRKIKRDDLLNKRRETAGYDPITLNRYDLIKYLNIFNNNLFTKMIADDQQIYKKTKELSTIETNLRLQLLYEIYEISVNSGYAKNTDYMVKELQSLLDYDIIIDLFSNVDWFRLYNVEIEKITNDRENVEQKNQDMNEIKSMYNSIKYYDLVEKVGDSYIDTDDFENRIRELTDETTVMSYGGSSNSTYKKYTRKVHPKKSNKRTRRKLSK